MYGVRFSGVGPRYRNTNVSPAPYIPSHPGPPVNGWEGGHSSGAGASTKEGEGG